MPNKATIVFFNESTGISMSSARVLSALLSRHGLDNNIIAFNPDVPIKPSDLQALCTNGIISNNIIAINMRRCDFNGAFDSSNVFITWIQDEVDWMHNTSNVSKWNDSPNDWMIGYANRCLEFGYTSDKMIEMPFLILDIDYNDIANNPANVKYDFVFASNKGSPIDDLIQYNVKYICELNNINFASICSLVADMQAYYKSGYKICGYDSLYKFIASADNALYQSIMDMNNAVARHTLINIFIYWHINEKFYRWSVLDWIIKSGFSLSIAGHGWDKNSLYSKYAVPFVDNNNIKDFYRSGKYCLHLNSLEAFHHRPTEILMSNGGKLIMRGKSESTISESFDKELYIKTQDSIVKHIIDKIFNGSKEKSPDINYLYRTHSFGKKIDSFEDINKLAD